MEAGAEAGAEAGVEAGMGAVTALTAYSLPIVLVPYFKYMVRVLLRIHLEYTKDFYMYNSIVMYDKVAMTLFYLEGKNGLLLRSLYYYLKLFEMLKIKVISSIIQIKKPVWFYLI